MLILCIRKKISSFIGQECQQCPVFEDCRAALAALVLCRAIEIAKNEEEICSLQSKRILGEIGVGVASNFTTVTEKSAAHVLAEEINACDGPVKNGLFEKRFIPIPPEWYNFASLNAIIVRRPIDTPAGTEPTVRIDTNRDGMIKDLDTEEGAEGFTRFGDYQRVFPPNITTFSPFGNLHNDRTHCAEGAINNILKELIPVVSIDMTSSDNY